MRILFDQNTPLSLRKYLVGHDVCTAAMMGWEEMQNGHLLEAAESAGFEVFITCDHSLAYQQNLTSRAISIVELTKNNWPSVEPHVAQIVAAVDCAEPGTYRVVKCTYRYNPRILGRGTRS